MTKEVLETKKKVKEALKREFGFTVQTLKEIVLQEEIVTSCGLYVLFRIGTHCYKLQGTKVVRV